MYKIICFQIACVIYLAIIQTGSIHAATILNRIELWICITLLHEIRPCHAQQIHILIFNL